MKVLVIAEHNNLLLKDTTLSTITAGTKITPTTDLLLIGALQPELIKQASSCYGISTVYTVSDPQLEHPIAESFAPLIASHARGYSHILMPSSSFGKDILPRVAALLDVAAVSDVIEILEPNKYKRPIYAGNAVATVQANDPIVCMTIRGTAFAKATLHSGTATVESLSVTLPPYPTATFLSQEQTKSARPELTSAKIVVSGGRAFGSMENFKMLETFADKIGAAIGASRAAVDAGFAPNDYQVGQTGKIVAPELYIAIGISGVIQHVAGMKDSKVIVAINKDENAPIFEISDYYLVGDLFDILPKLQSLM